MKMDKKITVCFIIVTILLIMMAIPTFAEKPNKNGTASLVANLTIAEQQKLVDVAFAEYDLTVLRLLPQTASYIMAIYSVETSTGYSNYHLLLGGNARTVTIDTMDGTRITQFHINSKSTVYHYVWSDTNDGGWVYSYVETETQFPCNSVLFYRTVAGENGIDHNLTNLASNLVVGDGVLNECAQSWLDTYNVKVNGQQGKYTEQEYQQAITTARQAGRLDVQNNPNEYGLKTEQQMVEYGNSQYQTGINYVISNPSFYNLYTQSQYEQNYSKGHTEGYTEGYNVGYKEGGNGQTTVVENPSIQMDVEGLVFSIPAMFNSILQGAFDFTIFGINVLGLILTIVIILVFVWFVRKLK